MEDLLYDVINDEVLPQNKVSSITWEKQLTTLIDLSVMIDNDLDRKNTRISDLPTSIHHSIIRKEASNKDENQEQLTLNHNLIQIGINNRVIVYDLSPIKLPKRNIFGGYDAIGRPLEVTFFSYTNQLMTPETYVNAGIQMIQNYEDPTKRRDGHLFNYIVSNRDSNESLIM